MAETTKTKKKRNPILWLISFILYTALSIAAAIILVIGGINFYMIGSTNDQVITNTEAAALSDVDYILVLGASVHAGTPSTMLKDRLDTAITIYQGNSDDRFLMSGDSSDQYYDEVGTMKSYCMEQGVPEEAIDLDPAGLSTYESVENVIKESNAGKVIIVTQRYHMYRALFLANHLGVDAYGVCATESHYTGQTDREIREIFARCKDFVLSIFGEKSKTLIGNLILKVDQSGMIKIR